MSDNEKAPLLPHKPDPALLEGFRYINQMPGKNVRGKLIDCFQLWMKVESDEVLDVIKVWFPVMNKEKFLMNFVWPHLAGIVFL